MNKTTHSTKNSFRANISLTRPATRKMVQARTVELASLDGRSSHEINQRDYEQAKFELLAVSDFDKQQTLLNAPHFA